MGGGECAECTKKKNGLQRKLSIRASNDPLEQEADRIADQVMAASAHSYLNGVSPRIQRFTGQATGENGTAPASVDRVLASPGKPLEPALQQEMDQRFGYDFSRVRVHTDAAAEQSARDVNAHAYTVGHQMVFGAGQFAPGTHEGRRLIAHELTHVVQQGFRTQAIQRKGDKKTKAATTNYTVIFNEIKKRNPDLAELISPQSIDPNRLKEPPAIRGGPAQNKEEHLWKVRVTAAQAFAFSQTDAGGEARKKMKGVTQVTHFINITWALPLVPDKEFLKQAQSENEAFALSAAEPLFHELLHARIMMERDPHWTGKHTQVFQDYTNILHVSGSSSVDKERQALKRQIGVMASLGGLPRAKWLKAADFYYEFLVHEKFDVDTESKAFGKSYPNALIAQKYSEVVARRLGADNPLLKGQREQLAKAAETLFDKLDHLVQTPTRSMPSSPPAPK